MMEDFYTLTPWHDNTFRAGFTAYSFMDARDDTGYIMAFRMEDCGEEDLTVTLPYAKDGNWVLTDEDTGETIPVTDGKVTLHFDAPRTARLLWVKRA